MVVASKSNDEVAIEKFLTALTELSREHGIVIGGCGYCGSPFLMDFVSDFLDPGGQYHLEPRMAGIRWISKE